MVAAYRGYLFDLDGTLVDSAPDINAALNHALACAGFDGVSEDLTRHWVGHGGQVLVEQALLHQGGPADVVAEVVQRFLEYYEQHIADHSKLYPHVVDTLKTLNARGARLAVVTNKRTQLTLPLLETLELRDLFHSVVCGDTTARPKPAADPAVHACAELGLGLDQVLFVGDSDTDVACARAAGCAVVCVPDGYNHGVPAAELGADAVIDSFRDLV